MFLIFNFCFFIYLFFISILDQILDMIRSIKDPEKPETLEELNVLKEEFVQISYIASLSDTEKETGIIRIGFTPTVEHCSLAAHIGLCIRTKLNRELPDPNSFKVCLFSYLFFYE